MFHMTPLPPRFYSKLDEPKIICKNGVLQKSQVFLADFHAYFPALVRYTWLIQELKIYIDFFMHNVCFRVFKISQKKIFYFVCNFLFCPVYWTNAGNLLFAQAFQLFFRAFSERFICFSLHMYSYITLINIKLGHLSLLPGNHRHWYKTLTSVTLPWKSPTLK